MNARLARTGTDKNMKRRLPAIALAAMLGLGAVGTATGEDLMQIYREAQLNDPVIAAAKATWEATQERTPIARSGLLPNVQVSAGANANNYDATIRSDPRVDVNRSFSAANAIVSASQPLFRYQNWVAYQQAKEQVTQADFTLAIAQQDLIVRVADAYFAVLLAEFNIELAESQKKAVSEQLAQAKRNFEVGVATITDTNEAQAKYDGIVAQEIAVRNEYDNRMTFLRAIIGRPPQSLKKIGQRYEPRPPEPNTLDHWVNRALEENLNVRFAKLNYDIATLEVDRQKAGHYPTLDLTGSYNVQGSNGTVNSGVSSDSRSGSIGLQLAVPIYQGGFVNAKVREAVALQERYRQDLETARRTALFQAQTGFSGVNSAVALVKAYEQAVVSAQSALDSNMLGQEVGIRTFLDVLTVQQNVYTARRDLASSYFAYIVGALKLKQSVGTLTEQDIEYINLQLKG
jgi:outer membrane protein